MSVASAVQVEPYLDVKAELGEGPLWSPREQSLYWIDVTRRLIFRHDTRTGKTWTHSVSGMPGSIALCENGGVLAAYRTGLAHIDLATGTETRIPSSIDFGIERFNDGKCDRRGRFFAGTMDKTMVAPVGALYRVDPDRSVTRLAEGIRLSNGIAWSPDDRTMYHCDSRPGVVYAYDYDIATGTPSNRRVHIDFTDRGYHCDGCTVDAEGFLWIAEVGGWHVGRYAPDGRRVSGIELPAKRVSSVMFGGPDLDTLFITTMYYNLKPDEVAAQPLAGRLFAARPGVRGLPEPYFAG
ncbi:MAG: SMP-30/gluconolactonase/LRE family protein [Casimicrobiaceae bacterium]